MVIAGLLFFLSIAIILGGAAVFTNGVEWLGRRLGISDGAIGSILAGIATALPETLIPVIAIFAGTSETESQIGLGAILGAPMMLSTLTIPLLAGFLLVLVRMRRRAGEFELDYSSVRLDLRFFRAAGPAAAVDHDHAGALARGFGRRLQDIEHRFLVLVVGNVRLDGGPVGHLGRRGPGSQDDGEQ